MAGPLSAVCPATAGLIRRGVLMVDAGGGVGEPGVWIVGAIQRGTGQQMSVEDEMRGSYRGGGLLTIISVFQKSLL